jgi:hypothetical protein
MLAATGPIILAMYKMLKLSCMELMFQNVDCDFAILRTRGFL